MFIWQITLDRHGPRPLPNICLLPDPPCLSFPTTFKYTVYLNSYTLLHYHQMNKIKSVQKIDFLRRALWSINLIKSKINRQLLKVFFIFCFFLFLLNILQNLLRPGPLGKIKLKRVFGPFVYLLPIINVAALCSLISKQVYTLTQSQWLSHPNIHSIIQHPTMQLEQSEPYTANEGGDLAFALYFFASRKDRKRGRGKGVHCSMCACATRIARRMHLHLVRRKNCKKGEERTIDHFVHVQKDA